MQKELQLIGMGKNEARTYEALVQYGPCRAGLLINKLDIHRNLVYQSLENLALKGFITKYIKKGIWNFQITDPNSLLSGFHQQENILKEVIEGIQTQHTQARQQIVVYEGIASYRNYWIESLKRIPEGSIDYTVGAPPHQEWVTLLGSSYKEYMTLRISKKIQWKTIHFKMTPGEWKMLKQYPELTEYRLWSREAPCIGNFNIIHDTIILHTVVNPPRIIEIRDANLVLVFRNYFDMMWEKSEKVIL